MRRQKSNLIQSNVVWNVQVCGLFQLGITFTTLDLTIIMTKKCFITAPLSGPQTPTMPPSEDPCSPNPCWNGGTCNNNSNPYTCSCVFGYSGANCDINSYEGKNLKVNMHSKKFRQIDRQIYFARKYSKYLYMNNLIKFFLLGSFENLGLMTISFPLPPPLPSP